MAKPAFGKRARLLFKAHVVARRNKLCLSITARQVFKPTDCYGNRTSAATHLGNWTRWKKAWCSAGYPCPASSGRFARHVSNNVFRQSATGAVRRDCSRRAISAIDSTVSTIIPSWLSAVRRSLFRYKISGSFSKPSGDVRDTIALGQTATAAVFVCARSLKSASSAMLDLELTIIGIFKDLAPFAVAASPNSCTSL